MTSIRWFFNVLHKKIKELFKRIFKPKPKTVHGTMRFKDWHDRDAERVFADILGAHQRAIDDGLISATKAYADERQKLPHNRSRHPSKHMRNLYHLKRD